MGNERAAAGEVKTKGKGKSRAKLGGTRVGQQIIQGGFDVSASVGIDGQCHGNLPNIADSAMRIPSAAVGSTSTNQVQLSDSRARNFGSSSSYDHDHQQPHPTSSGSALEEDEPHLSAYPYRSDAHPPFLDHSNSTIVPPTSTSPTQGTHTQAAERLDFATAILGSGQHGAKAIIRSSSSVYSEAGEESDSTPLSHPAKSTSDQPNNTQSTTPTPTNSRIILSPDVSASKVADNPHQQIGSEIIQGGFGESGRGLRTAGQGGQGGREEYVITPPTFIQALSEFGHLGKSGEGLGEEDNNPVHLANTNDDSTAQADGDARSRILQPYQQYPIETDLSVAQKRMLAMYSSAGQHEQKPVFGESEGLTLGPYLQSQPLQQQTSPQFAYGVQTLSAAQSTYQPSPYVHQPLQPQAQAQAVAGPGPSSLLSRGGHGYEGSRERGDVKAGIVGPPAKIFKCMNFEGCEMTFTRSEHLARHVRKHTGERPFPCHCHKSFSRLDNLRQHAATVHADQQELNDRMLRALAPVHHALSQRAGKEQKKRGEVLEVAKPPASGRAVSSSKSKGVSWEAAEHAKMHAESKKKQEAEVASARAQLGAAGPGNATGSGSPIGGSGNAVVVGSQGGGQGTAQGTSGQGQQYGWASPGQSTSRHQHAPSPLSTPNQAQMTQSIRPSTNNSFDAQGYARPGTSGSISLEYQPSIPHPQGSPQNPHPHRPPQSFVPQRPSTAHSASTSSTLRFARHSVATLPSPRSDNAAAHEPFPYGFRPGSSGGPFRQQVHWSQRPQSQQQAVPVGMSRSQSETGGGNVVPNQGMPFGHSAAPSQTWSEQQELPFSGGGFPGYLAGNQMQQQQLDYPQPPNSAGGDPTRAPSTAPPAVHFQPDYSLSPLPPNQPQPLQQPHHHPQAYPSQRGQYSAISHASSGHASSGHTSSGRSALSSRGHSSAGLPHQGIHTGATQQQLQELYGNSGNNQDSPFSYHPPPTATGPGPQEFYDYNQEQPTSGYGTGGMQQQQQGVLPPTAPPTAGTVIPRKRAISGRDEEGMGEEAVKMGRMGGGGMMQPVLDVGGGMYFPPRGERRSSLAISNLLSGGGVEETYPAQGSGGGGHFYQPQQGLGVGMEEYPAAGGYRVNGGYGEYQEGQGVYQEQGYQPQGMVVGGEMDMDAKAKALLGQGYEV